MRVPTAASPRGAGQPYVERLQCRGMEDLRLTPLMGKVIRVFLEDPARSRYGLELMRLTSLPSGTLYPMLSRFASSGWLIGSQEDIDPKTAGRPRRRTYTITDEAAASARVQLAALSEELRPPAVRLGQLRPQRGSE